LKTGTTMVNLKPAGHWRDGAGPSKDGAAISAVALAASPGKEFGHEGSAVGIERSSSVCLETTHPGTQSRIIHQVGRIANPSVKSRRIGTPSSNVCLSGLGIILRQIILHLHDRLQGC
jgi:hypothetical protein